MPEVSPRRAPMTRVPAPRVLASLCLAAIFVLTLTPRAMAQYRPLPAGSYGTAGNPVGEPYHVEFAFNLWSPEPNIVIASESLGIAGTNINVQADLGVEKKQTYEFRLVLRPGKKHKFRFNYVPLKYDADTTLRADIIFNGIKYPLSTSVATKLEWRTYRLGYEYDFVSNPRGFFGMVLEAKFTDINVELNSAIANEYARVRAPIPAIGAVGRVYVTRNVAITGEFTALKIPDSINAEYGGHYYEWEVYGTMNFTKNLGAQLGWRAQDLAYLAKQDSGNAQLKGSYFGGVARF
jgi:hypothetical protein